jgi:hypothetical protein
MDPLMTLRGTLTIDTSTRIVPFPGTEDEWSNVENAEQLFPAQPDGDQAAFNVKINTGVIEPDLSAEGPVKDLLDRIIAAGAVFGENPKKAYILGGMPFVADCIPIPVDRFTVSASDPVSSVEQNFLYILDTFANSEETGNLLDGEDYESVRNGISPVIAGAKTIEHFNVPAQIGSLSKETASPLFFTCSHRTSSQAYNVYLTGYNREYEGLLTVAEDKNGTFTTSHTCALQFKAANAFPRGDVNCQVTHVKIEYPVQIEKGQILQIGCEKLIDATANYLRVNAGGTIRFSRRPFVKPAPSTEPAGG